MRKTTKILLFILVISIISCGGFYTYRYFAKSEPAVKQVKKDNDIEKTNEKNIPEGYYEENLLSPIVWIDTLENISQEINEEGAVYNIDTKDITKEIIYEGKEINGIFYENVKDEIDSYRAVKKNGYWGYINSNGKEITKFIYDYAYNFSEGYAAVKRNDKCGYIDKTGKEIVGCCWEATRPMFGGKALIEFKEYFNSEGVWRKAKIVNGAPVNLNRNDNKVDTTDANVIWQTEPIIEYDEIMPLLDNNDGTMRSHFLVERDKLLGVVNEGFNLIVPVEYADITSCGECGIFLDTEIKYKDGSLIRGRENGHGGGIETDKFFDMETKILYAYAEEDILSPTEICEGEIITITNVKQYEGGVYFPEGENCKFCYAKRLSEIPTAKQYDAASQFNNNFAAVSINNKWTFINLNGEEITEFIYNNVYDFSEGYAAVERDGKWGYIDENGEEIVSCVYEKTFPVVNGKCFIKKNDKWGIAEIVR